MLGSVECLRRTTYLKTAMAGMILASQSHCVFIAPVFADMVWPALLLEQRILGVLPILAGLIVEWLALWLGGFGLTWKRAAVVDLVMNAVSTAAGIVLIPILGIAWEVFPGSVLYSVFKVGTFNPGTWAATFSIAVVATTAVEVAVVKLGFEISLDRKKLWVLLGANTVSVAIAFASLWTRPPRW